ncbi:MAG: hypothetical protein ACI83B_001016 [Sediminicola sp.]|jgi:hypothetical protein
MKTTTSGQMGGSCDLEFRADTIQEMTEMSKNFGREMFQKENQPHLNVITERMNLKSSQNAMQD